MRADASFASAWDAALEVAADVLEKEAFRRATRKTRPSDLLLIFLLKGCRPQKYRENVALEVAGGLVLRHNPERATNGASPPSTAERLKLALSGTNGNGTGEHGDDA